MAPVDEELVVRAIADHDTKAYGELVQRHQAKVRGWLRQLTRNPALADDIAQDTFIRAWDKLHTFAGKGKFAAWLMKIAYNEFLQAERRSKREKLSVERMVPAEHDTAMTSSAGKFADEFTDLPRFLSVLSPDEQRVMMLVYAFDLSHREASEVADIPVGTIKSHVHRGKEKIRKHFELGESTER